ncbi:hypothetical protein [Asticcacaulis sp.]|uniref:hypothetical protein n=1 Tax=Asticcacaulis sp. TaxID=1872648 RepID=UPI0031E34855
MPDLSPHNEPPKKNGLNDYGPKTGAASDHPYGTDEMPPAPKTEGTPPDARTEVSSQADLGDPTQTG